MTTIRSHKRHGKNGPNFESIRSYLQVFIFGLSFMIFFPGPSGTFAQPFPTKDFYLSDWKLNDFTEIGHISLGVLHTKEGDKLIIYDIRKKKPSPEFIEPQSHTPEFEGDAFVVSHFNRGNVNRLGGYFNGFAKAPSSSYLAIKETPDGGPALAYSYIKKPKTFAGFWIHLFDFKLPPSERLYFNARPFTHLTFSIRGEKGGENFSLRMADRVWEEKQDSFLIGNLDSYLPGNKLGKKWQRVWVSLPKGERRLNMKELSSVVFQVRENGKGRIFIKDLAFTTQKDVAIAGQKMKAPSSRKLSKAMWLWETNKIANSDREINSLIAFCAQQKITDLFVQIPYEAKKEPDGWQIYWDSKGIRQFMSQLSKAGIRVHALDGDPRFALKEWHGRVTALIKEIIKYNHSVPSQERFIGIRFDIEPYLLPRFGGTQKESQLKEYLELLELSKNLTRNEGLVFGVDIPFWFDSMNELYEPIANVAGRPVTESIIDIVDNVGIMDYRTVAYGADGVIAHAMDELRYADKMGKNVFIGLETVPLPDETIYEFAPRGKGARALINKSGPGKAQITWIPAGKQVSNEEGIALHQTRIVPVSAGKITFDKKYPEDLMEVMEQAEGEFKQFSSFQGFIIHSYESYRPWLKRRKP